MNIFEIIKNNYNIENEFIKIKEIFESKIFFLCHNDIIPKLTIENIADNNFSKWNNRNGICNCTELKNKIINYMNKNIFNNCINDNYYNNYTNKGNCTKIEKAIISSHNYDPFEKIESIVIYLEYFINIIIFVESLDIFNDIKRNNNAYDILNDNIDILLEHINYEEFEDKEKERILLIPKNPEAIAVAEKTENTQIANAILEYNHYSLKGNVEEKRNLLFSIYKEYEEYFNKKSKEYGKEFGMVGCLVNNCHIRHNNKEGKDKREYIVNLDNRELEELYDDIYQLILFCILAGENKNRMKKLEEVKEKLTKN